MSAKLINSDDKQIQMIINDSITVTIDFDAFEKDGAMDIDYDETLLTEQEATQLTQSYFDSILEFIKNNADKIKEGIKND